MKAELNPLIFREKERLSEYAAANHVVVAGVVGLVAIISNPLPHRREGRCAIAYAECLPGY
jgi:hypothetical protein